MINNYYIQSKTSPTVDIYSEFGVITKETNGLVGFSSRKKIWSRDWPEEQGLDTYFHQDGAKFEDKSVVVTFLIIESDKAVLIQKMKTFLSYIYNGGDLSYYDTYKKEGFRGYCNSNKTKLETYRIGRNYIEFNVVFNVPNGICYAFGASTIKYDFQISEGKADFYFSDGSQSKNKDTNFTKMGSYNFVLINPSIFRNVKATIT